MKKAIRPLALAAACCVVLGCDKGRSAALTSEDEQSPEEFVAELSERLDRVIAANSIAGWVRATYLTDDTAFLAARAQAEFLKLHSELVAEAATFRDAELSPAVARSLYLLRLGTAMPAPDDAALRTELTQIATRMEGAYGAGRYCRTPASCQELEDLERVLARSRDYDTLLDAWAGWRTVAPPIRADYARFVEISNAGARQLGFIDLGELWRSGYDMAPEDFRADMERLWQQVKPLYDALHCYVRGRLSDHYGAERVPPDGPIPAHVLGNMWAQQWAEIYDLVEPYPGVANLDVDAALQSQAYTPRRMTESAEAFFTSLGWPELPDTFWQRSLLAKPADRDLVCHASAWTVADPGDVRIKMCIEPTWDDLVTIYHELGHIYYYLAYADQPPLFRAGAHDGFHEGIGDTVTLSVTPGFLARIGLIDAVKTSHQATINTQMKQALDRVAFLPFGRLIDQWRWDVFAGRVTPEQYNAAWWELRHHYQGIAAPVARSEADFDPGAKYHIPANVPYTRYFLAYVLQFQFHRVLCDLAGHEGPLHECSVFGSEAAGQQLWSMLAAGASEPWPETLEKLTGTRAMDASAIIDYFAPLMDWLAEQNAPLTCGW
jgi:peptidyl-dipeptidase A